MMRRLTSAPNPASRVAAMTSSAEPAPGDAQAVAHASKRARLDDASLGRIR